MTPRRRPERWIAAVERATGYEYSGALALVRSQGANPRTCSLEEIVLHVRAALAARRERPAKPRKPRYVRTGRTPGRVTSAADGRLEGRPVAFGGESLSLTEWAKRVGVSRQVLHDRVKRLGVEIALSKSLARPGVWPRGKGMTS